MRTAGASLMLDPAAAPREATAAEATYLTSSPSQGSAAAPREPDICAGEPGHQLRKEEGGMLSLLHLPEEGRRGGGGGRHWKVRRVDANVRRSLAIRKRSPLPFPAKRPSVVRGA